MAGKAYRTGDAGFPPFPGLNAIENVLLPAQFHHWRIPTSLRQRAADLLAQVGLDTGKRPVEVLSRGEKQRVAVARALLSNPDIIVADEPTASLDAQSGEQIADLLVTLARESRATLIAITHDARLASQMSRCIQLEKDALWRTSPIRRIVHDSMASYLGRLASAMAGCAGRGVADRGGDSIGHFGEFAGKSITYGSAKAADRFDLVIGAPGSETQLVLSSVFCNRLR